MTCGAAADAAAADADADAAASVGCLLPQDHLCQRSFFPRKFVWPASGDAAVADCLSLLEKYYFLYVLFYISTLIAKTSSCSWGVLLLLLLLVPQHKGQLAAAAVSQCVLRGKRRA